MLTRLRLEPVLGVLLLATTITIASGCAKSPASPSASVAPVGVFSSDEAAVSAAETAIKKYVSATNLISANGGGGVDALAALSTTEQFTTDRDAYANYSNAGLRQHGEATATDFQIQQRYESDQRAHVLVYFCLDYSGTQLFDKYDADVTPSYFASPALFAAELVSKEPNSEELVVASSLLREGSTACIRD